MMHDQPRLTFCDHGAERFAGALAGSFAALRAALAHLPSEQAGVRIRGIEALRPFSPEMEQSARSQRMCWAKDAGR
jgi:hypothetical protein